MFPRCLYCQTEFVLETPTRTNTSYRRYIHNFIKHDDNEQFSHYDNHNSQFCCILVVVVYIDGPAQRHFNNNKHNKKYGLALTSHWNKSSAAP